MEIAHNHNAKSQLAKLLATENISVQHEASAKTAMFDVKNRVLILPVWREMSNDLYDMLVVHEVGHALDTPMFIDELEALSKKLSARPAVVKGFFNVIEDARIDKRQKRRFPGSRRNYIKGYAELLEKDFFGTARRDVNSMTFIDRINVHFKAGAMSGVKFSVEEKSFIKRIEDAETIDEVFTLVEDVYNFTKNSKSEDQDSDDTEQSFTNEDTDEEFDEEFKLGRMQQPGDEDSDEESEEDFDATASDDEDYDGDDEDFDADDSDDEDDNDGDINDGAKKNDTSDEVTEPETEKAWQRKQEELLANSDITYQYVTIPRPVNIGKMVDDYKIVHSQISVEIAAVGSSWHNAVRAELNDFRTSENSAISYMVKEFEMRKSADEYRRTATAKTGSLDTNKLHSYKYNDDLFRRITTVAEGKNHGFVMFVDWSGSMQHNLKKTMKQLFSLVWFCKRVQIPFEVYSFRDLSYKDEDPTSSSFNHKTGDIEMRTVKLRNILSSRMNVASLNTALFNLWAIACGFRSRSDDLMSTPLNEAIAVADVVINEFKRRTKVQVVNAVFLTDGESNGNGSIHNVYPVKKTKFIIHDETTKKNYDLPVTSYGFNFGKKLTSTLLTVLKDRTNCNLIGFYVYNDSVKTLMIEFYGYSYDEQFAKTVKKSYEDNGFAAVTNAGYDEYYILRAASMDIKKNLLVVNPSMSKAKIKSAFLAFSEKKAVNRVLLQRFIAKIAA